MRCKWTDQERGEFLEKISSLWKINDEKAKLYLEAMETFFFDTAMWSVRESFKNQESGWAPQVKDLTDKGWSYVNKAKASKAARRDDLISEIGQYRHQVIADRSGHQWLIGEGGLYKVDGATSRTTWVFMPFAGFQGDDHKIVPYTNESLHRIIEQCRATCEPEKAAEI